MRITCPSCAAEYEVPTTRLTPHRMVRCVRCGGEWVAQEVYVPEVGAPEADAREAGTHGPPLVSADAFAAQAAEWHASPAMTAMDRLAATVPLPRRSVGLTAAWILTLFVLVAGIASSIVWREAFVRAWPPTSVVLGSPGGAATAIQGATIPPPAEPRAKPRNEPAEKP
jgi:predicted Zn finger-like uncharacterized protein